MLTLVSFRLGPSPSRPVGRRTPVPLPLRQLPHRAVLLPLPGQQRIATLQRGTHLLPLRRLLRRAVLLDPREQYRTATLRRGTLKGVLHPGEVTGRAMGLAKGVGTTGRAALRRRRPIVVMKSRSLSERIGWQL